MHILLSCLQSKVRHAVPAYKYWETYFVGGIEEAGHEWSAVDGADWAEGLLYGNDPVAAAEWRGRTWQRVLDDVSARPGAMRPDLFLSYLYPWMVEEAAIRELQRQGIRCVNYFCDNVREFVRAPREFRVFDLNWVPELAATKFYQRDGVPFIHAAMPTWVPFAQRTAMHEERYGVTFIGGRDSQRELLFAEALRLGAPIELRGAGWPGSVASGAPGAPVAGRARRSYAALVRNQARFLARYGAMGMARKIAERFRSPIPDATFAAHTRPAPNADEYVAITQGSRIVLGTNRYPSYRHPFATPDTYSRGRDIEAPMMGACYLTEWTPELEEMYDLGREVETYRTPAEMVERIHSLLAQPERRRSMRVDAQRRALADHSVPRSLERIGERLGIPHGDRVAR